MQPQRNNLLEQGITPLYNRLSRRLNRLVNSGQAHVLQGGRKGVEREALRITPAGELSQLRHPTALGSTLTHSSITTDYSEAQLELVTQPFTTVTELFSHLKEIHLFVHSHLPGHELLWSTSMPCVLHGEKSVPIAEFGTSNLGRMKHTYRRGLDVRYGRIMQSISGVHFNYSVAEEFWPLYQEVEENRGALRTFTDEAYFGLLRNVLRYEWLITYLFGNSPALCRSFFAGRETPLQLLDGHSYFAPYATSLRMSNIGYKNHMPSSLHVSYNSLDQYVTDLIGAVQTPHPPYQKLGVVVDGVYQQLNANILQIENEFYSAVRPKQPGQGDERPLMALRNRGVGYVEVRALDINTFDPLGFAPEQARFLEAFLLFCLLHESPPLTEAERKLNAHNQRVVAQNGRDPQARLLGPESERSLRDWASELLDAMEPIATLLEDAAPGYTAAISTQRESVLDPERTPSARMLREMKEHDESFFRYGLRISQEHYETLRQHTQAPDQTAMFEQLAQDSLLKQAQLEASDAISFEQYLQDYADQLG